LCFGGKEIRKPHEILTLPPLHQAKKQSTTYFIIVVSAVGRNFTLGFGFFVLGRQEQRRYDCSSTRDLSSGRQDPRSNSSRPRRHWESIYLERKDKRERRQQDDSLHHLDLLVSAFVGPTHDARLINVTCSL
jgi:hypothetical protein